MVRKCFFDLNALGIKRSFIDSEGFQNVTCHSTDFSITVVNGKFTWAKEDPPALHRYVA